MKKILLATTVLGMSAGFASAEVAVSGSARMGVVSTDGASVFSSRVKMKFSGSGTTDGGLAFGGSFDANKSKEAEAGASGSVFISGAFGKISMGDVDSGDAAAVGQLASVGYTGLDSTNSINYAADGFDLFGLPALVEATGATGGTLSGSSGFNYEAATEVVGGAGAKVLYTYSAGGLTLDASTSQISNGPADHNSYGVGVAYTTGGLTLAAGYGSNEWEFETTYDITPYLVAAPGAPIYTYDPEFSDGYHVEGDVTDATVAATYVMGDTTLKAIYQDKEVSGEVNGEDAVSATATSMGLSVVHKIGAVTLTAFGVTTDLTSNVTSATEEESISFTRTGLGVAYDLGGGASLKAGVVNVEVPHLDAGFSGSYPTIVPTASIDTASYTAYDIGVNFSF